MAQEHHHQPDGSVEANNNNNNHLVGHDGGGGAGQRKHLERLARVVNEGDAADVDGAGDDDGERQQQQQQQQWRRRPESTSQNSDRSTSSTFPSSNATDLGDGGDEPEPTSATTGVVEPLQLAGDAAGASADRDKGTSQPAGGAVSAPASGSDLRPSPPQQQHTVIECAGAVDDDGDERHGAEGTKFGQLAAKEPPQTQSQSGADGISTNNNNKNDHSHADEATETTAQESKVSNCAPIALLPIEQSHQQPHNQPQQANNHHHHHQTPADSSKQPTTDSNNNEHLAQQLKHPNHLHHHNNNNNQRHQHTTTTSDNHNNLNSEEFCKRRRLSYLQSLLLRKWPCLAIGICIMSSLLFGMLLSALTVYLMHGWTDCSGLALAAGAGSPYLGIDALGRRPSEFDSGPIELASLTGAAGSGASSSASSEAAAGSRYYSAALAASGSESAAAAAAPTSATSSEKPRFQRLPSSVWPIHYDLFIQPRIAEPFNFSGKVSIRIKCTEPTDNITLHALDLELNERSISLKLAGNSSSGSGGKVVPKVTGLSQDKQLQYSIVGLSAPLESGQEYVLAMDFSGFLNDDLAGFYKIKYQRQNSTNETTWIAATQFQSTDARRAFPCFDEPLYKATFSIQIKHWKNMTALSNMPIIDRQESPDSLWVTDTFSKTHRMSTYLVAYAITNFESRSEGNISVWTRPGLLHSAEYALKIAGKILRHYESFFGIEYPLPKMDMIALPDFNAGAMENWGLITYRETAMLYDEASSSVANKLRVAVVVAHELAHQWFGNLVTPKWWDDLWLNEGFASYVEYIGVDHVEPTWRMLDQFVITEVQDVFKLDGLSSSHQISMAVNNPEEITEIFDHISYSKGASVIRMMNHFLTAPVFKLGLRRYLRALKYSNAEQSDLWAHLTEAQHESLNQGNTTTKEVDVEKVMNSWTLQTGFPLVTLTRHYDGRPAAELSQVRYQPYKLATTVGPANKTTTTTTMKTTTTSAQAAAAAAGERWEIPITFTSKSELNWAPTTRLWMAQNDTRPTQLGSDMVPSSNDDWMLVNLDQVGYYRVNYDLRNWKLLIEQLNTDHTVIKSTNRAQILDDVFELARSGLINYQFALEATKYLRAEHDYMPWEAVLTSFSYIEDMLQRTPIYGLWRDYISDLIAPYYARYRDSDWKVQRGKSAANATATTISGDLLEQYNQVNAINVACSNGEPYCIGKAKSLFADWRQTGRNEILPALRYMVYCMAIEHGSTQDWDFLWRAYEKEQNASERDRILRSLGCSKDMWVLARYLDWTFDRSKPIRRQDGAYVFRVIAKNNYGRDLAFNFMREHWATIKEFYGKTSFSLGHLIRSVSGAMNTQTELNELTNFYELIRADVGTGKRSFQIALEEVESNVQWRQRNYKILEGWLHETRAKQQTAVEVRAN